MNFLKKLFFKDVYDEMDELKYKIILMNDKRQLINKKITMDITDMNPIINGPLYYLYYYLSSSSGDNTYNISDKLDELRHVEEGPIIYKKHISFYEGNSKYYEEGEYFKEISLNAYYILAYFKIIQILKEARNKYFLDSKEEINKTNSFYFKRLISIEEDVLHLMWRYSDMFAIHFDTSITSNEKESLDLIVKSTLFKESQILSNSIVDADLLKEKNKLLNKKLNGDFIYELVSVSDKQFELHFSATCVDADGKENPEDVFIQHKFIPMMTSDDCGSLYLEMLSSIVINTKFFTEEEDTQ